MSVSESKAVRWVPVGRPESLRFAPGAVVKAEDHELAVFKRGDDDYCALLNSCPHAGASLAEGHVADGEVSCPWHGWRFDLATGVCKTIFEDSTRAFPVRLHDGVLEVGL